MKLSTTSGIITISFLLAFSGFIVSMVMPKDHVSDALMIAALYCAASSGIVAAIFTKKLSKSKQWIYVIIGGIILLLSFPVKFMGYEFLNNILKVSGGAIAISALGYYIYLHPSDFQYSKWIWFLPFILVGCIFKYMYWYGGNVIIFISIFLIAVLSIVQLFKLKKFSLVPLLILVWQLAMCACITVFYFRHIKLDPFVIGYIFTWLALVDILLQHEKNMLENNDFES